MNIDLTQFFQVFFEEAAEQLSTMETLLLALDVSNPSMDDLNAIFRSAHSIKGGAGTFGFTDMTEVTHVLETLLDRLRKEEMTLTDEMVSAFLDAGDVISTQLSAHRGEGEVDQEGVKAVCERLEQLTFTEPVQAERVEQTASQGIETSLPTVLAPAVLTAEEECYGFFDDRFNVPIPTPIDLGYGFFDGAPAAPVPVGFKPFTEADLGYGFFVDISELSEPNNSHEAESPIAVVSETTPAEKLVVKEVTQSVKSAAQTNTNKRTAEKTATPPAESSIRVSIEKVDQLINLAGELVITQAMLAQSAIAAISEGNEHLQRGLYQLERNTRDLQEAVMSIRMMPISFVFSRFPRLVRDLAGKLNKQVELKTVGENTELDKGLIEKISDPMTHLVRNSLDHGIESQEKRIAAGKDPRGTITLKAFHQGGNVVIEVADDGAGLSRSKILAKAIEKGLPVRDDMTDQEVWALIMEPGFSTAEVITDVSGRGVGMDVVRRNITELGGRLELDSVEGVGSRTIIRLPLTLAILDGLSVSVGSETYIIPLNAIIESLQVTTADLKTVSSDGQLLRVRGEYLPLVKMYEVFNTQPKAIDLEHGIAVIVEAEGKKTALFVDELLGQHQVVIKSLESNFRKMPGISGATIMGDGRVALILDVAALIAHHG